MPPSAELLRRLRVHSGLAGRSAGDGVLLVALEQKVMNLGTEAEETLRFATQPVGLYEGRLRLQPDAVGSVAYGNGELDSLAALSVAPLALGNTDGGLTKYLDPKAYSWSGRAGVLKLGATDLDPAQWDTLPEGDVLLAQEPEVDRQRNLVLNYVAPAERLNRLAQANTFAGFGYAYRFHHDEAGENWINHGDTWDFGKIEWSMQVVLRADPRQSGQGARVLMQKRAAFGSGAGYTWISRGSQDDFRMQVEDDLGSEVTAVWAAGAFDSRRHTLTFVCARESFEVRVYLDDALEATLPYSPAGNITAPAGLDAILGWRSDGVTGNDDRADFDVSELRIWHKALSTEDVRGNWNRTLDPNTTGLEAIYRFNVNTGEKSYDERGGPRSRWLTLDGGYVEANDAAAGRPNPDDGSISASLQLTGKIAPGSDAHVFGKMDYIGNTPQDGWAIFYNSTSQELEVIIANGGSTVKVPITAAQFGPGQMTGIAFRYDPAGDEFLVVWVQQGRDLPLDLVGTSAGGGMVCPEATAPLSLMQPGAIAEPNGSTAGGGGQVRWNIHNAATHHEANALTADAWSYVEVPHNRDPVLTLDLPPVTPPAGGADYEVVFAYHAPLGGSGLDVTYELLSNGTPVIGATWLRQSVGPELVVERQKVPQASVPNPNTLQIRATWTQGDPPEGDDQPTTAYPLAVYLPDGDLVFNGIPASAPPWYRQETDDDTVEVGKMITGGPLVDRGSWLSPHWSPSAVSTGAVFEASIGLGLEPLDHDFTRLVIWCGRRLHEGQAAEISTLTVRLQSGTVDITRDLYLTGDADYGFRLTAAESAALDWEGSASVRVTETVDPAELRDSHPVVYEIWLEADYGDADVSAGYEGRNVAAAVIGGADYTADASTCMVAPTVLSLDALTGGLNYYVVPPDDWPDLPIDPKDPVYAWLELADSVLAVNPLLWRLDEGSGEIAYDAGPGQYHGTVIGGHAWGGLDGTIVPHAAVGSAKYEEIKNTDEPFLERIVNQGEWVPTYEGDPRLVGTQKPVVAGSAMGVPLVHVGGGQWQVSDPAYGTILAIRRIYANGLAVPAWQWSLVPDQNVAILGPEFDGYDVTADVYGIMDTSGASEVLRFLWRTDQIAERLLGPKGADLALDTSSLTTFASRYPYRIGLAYGLDRRWSLEDLMRFLAGPRGWWSQDAAGSWRLSALRDASAETVALHLPAEAITSVEILPTKDPTKEVRLGVRRQWQVIDTFLGAVSEPDRDRQGQEWRRSVWPHEATRQKIEELHPRSREWTPTSAISGEADGEIESEVLARTHGVPRRFYRLRVQQHLLELDHDDVMTFDWPGLEISAATGRFIVVGSVFGMQAAQPVWSIVVFGPYIPDDWYEATA